MSVDFSLVEHERASETAESILAMVSTADEDGASSAAVRSFALRDTKSLQVETLVALFLITVFLPVEFPASVLVLVFAASSFLRY